ncbi:MAG: DUF503 domain-containing protein [Chloroflexi bacterium]|jgi:uncharacterized protein YlxP (DUF503 family)|nr:DUF503 domain-containing protein [Chloroflexota bacterium]
MIVGVLTVDLQVPASRSLKDKRQVVRSLAARLRNNYNIAVAEVDHLDSWQLVTLGIAAVSGDLAHVQGLLQHVVDYIGREHSTVLLDYGTEYL